MRIEIQANLKKSILKTAEDKGYIKEDLKSYKVLCGGEKIDTKDYTETNPKQPLCKRFDYGVNPLEIVINRILKVNNYSLMNGRTRYDSKDVNFHPDDHFTNHLLLNLRSLYNKWIQYRDELLDQNNQSIEDYFFSEFRSY